MGLEVGVSDGDDEGDLVGDPVGVSEGAPDGAVVGARVGLGVGEFDLHLPHAIGHTLSRKLMSELHRDGNWDIVRKQTFP